MGFGLAGPDVDAMKAVAKAYQDRSIEEFQKTLQTYQKELQDDKVIHVHLSRLYDTLLEQNLCRLIEPYSRVEIEHLAKLIKLPTSDILSKLSQVCVILTQSSFLLALYNLFATHAAKRQ